MNVPHRGPRGFRALCAMALTAGLLLVLPGNAKAYERNGLEAELFEEIRDTVGMLDQAVRQGDKKEVRQFDRALDRMMKKLEEVERRRHQRHHKGAFHKGTQVGKELRSLERALETLDRRLERILKEEHKNKTGSGSGSTGGGSTGGSSSAGTSTAIAKTPTITNAVKPSTAKSTNPLIAKANNAFQKGKNTSAANNLAKKSTNFNAAAPFGQASRNVGATAGHRPAAHRPPGLGKKK